MLGHKRGGGVLDKLPSQPGQGRGPNLDQSLTLQMNHDSDLHSKDTID